MTYTSQEGHTYTLYPWFGQKVVMLTQSGSLDSPTMAAILAALDSAWGVYEQLTGRDPILNGPTTLNGRDIIAEVPDGATSCGGAACSYLGNTGTDLEATYFLVLYNGVLQNHQYDQAMFYEFGRNFWFYQSQMGPVDSFVTGFAIANRFLSMDRSSLSGGPFNNLSYSTFEQSDMIDLLSSYLANPAYSWRNTIEIGQQYPTPNNWSAADLAGSMFYRIYSDSGFEAYKMFWQALSTLPAATTPENVMTNFIAAAKTATGKDYSFLFKDSLLVITSTSPPPTATVGGTYSFSLAATGGSGLYRWSSADLPSWLSLSTSGTLSGFLPSAGFFAFTVMVTDGTQVSSLALTLGSLPPPPAATITSYSFSSTPTAGRAFSVTITGTGFDASIEVYICPSAASSCLRPPSPFLVTASGVKLNSATSVSVSNVNLAAGSYSIYVTTWAGGAFGLVPVFTVSAAQAAPTISNYSFGSTPTANVAFSATITGTGFDASTQVWFCMSGANTCNQKPVAGVTINSPTSVSVSNVSLAAGSYQIYVQTSAGKSPLSSAFTVNATPSVNPGGIVPINSATATIEPGEWASIYGSNLARGKVVWQGDFPVSLGGSSVTINGKAAYLWYVSPSQINFQAPDDTAMGTVPVVVTTASGSSTATVTLGQFGPSFSLLDTKHVAGIILRSDGSGAQGGGTYDIMGPTGTSLGYPTVAARAGDIVELFGVGFGPTNPAVPAGQAFSCAAATTNPVNLFINNVSITPSFAGLSSAGTYQINLTVPPGLGTGDVPLLATVGGVQTPSGFVISLQ